MKIVIRANATSEYVSEDEIKDNIFKLVRCYLDESKNCGIEIQVNEVSYPAN